MAYRAFPETEDAGVLVGASRTFAPILSTLEHEVVRLAKRDPLESAQDEGRLAPVVRALFGMRPPNRLADPRLEALRRYAVLARTAHPAPAETERLLAAGFTAAQAHWVRATVQSQA